MYKCCTKGHKVYRIVQNANEWEIRPTLRPQEPLQDLAVDDQGMNHVIDRVGPEKSMMEPVTGA